MLRSDGGVLTPGRTEKHSPCPWPSPWYGSWPRTSTFTRSNGVASRAAKTSSRGGKILCVARSVSTNSVSCWKYGLSNSSPRTSCQESGSMLGTSGTSGTRSVAGTANVPGATDNALPGTGNGAPPGVERREPGPGRGPDPARRRSSGDARVQEEPAVRDEGLAGDPARPLGQQERGGGADVLRHPEPLERIARRGLLLAALVERRGELGLDDRGGDGVHPH